MYQNYHYCHDYHIKNVASNATLHFKTIKETQSEIPMFNLVSSAFSETVGMTKGQFMMSQLEYDIIPIPYLSHCSFCI